MMKDNCGFIRFMSLIALIQLPYFCPTLCHGAPAADKQQERSQGKRLSKAQINTSLEKAHAILSGPETSGSQMRSKAVAEALTLEGNDAIPLLKEFIESDKISKRKFAFSVLVKVDTDESMKIVQDKFWELYKDKNAADQITVVGVAGAYQNARLNSKIEGEEHYWEARGILREILRDGSKHANGLCLKLYKEQNGVGVLASKYLWLKIGDGYDKEFLKYSESKVDSETFYTFIKEFADIFSKNEQDSYQGIQGVKNSFKKRAISDVSSTETNENILWCLIEYLSNAEYDWFADNWVELFKTHKSRAYLGSDIRTALLRGVSNNERAQKNIGKLKDILNEKEYKYFEDSIKNNGLKQHEKAKWESKTK